MGQKEQTFLERNKGNSLNNVKFPYLEKNDHKHGEEEKEEINGTKDTVVEPEHFFLWVKLFRFQLEARKCRRPRLKT